LGAQDGVEKKRTVLLALLGAEAEAAIDNGVAKDRQAALLLVGAHG